MGFVGFIFGPFQIVMLAVNLTLYLMSIFDVGECWAIQKCYPNIFVSKIVFRFRFSIENRAYLSIWWAQSKSVFILWIFGQRFETQNPEYVLWQNIRTRLKNLIWECLPLVNKWRDLNLSYAQFRLKSAIIECRLLLNWMDKFQREISFVQIQRASFY